MPNLCISCQRTIDPPNLRGTHYTCKGEGSGSIIQFWMCNPCAIPLGPSQGPIPKTLNKDTKYSIPGDPPDKK